MALLLHNLSSPSPALFSYSFPRRRHSPPPSLTAASTSTLSKLHAPSTHPPPPLQHAAGSGGGGGNRSEFYLNLGTAVRTLREDLPDLFARDLNYDIYRADITFIDPMNTFQGIEKYKLIFWALRFHGRILFREISLQVLRIWQPSDDTILVRWNLKGVPRVPWEAKGEFQGTSRYKLDRSGKIYEHKVDNLAFNFPRIAMKPATVLDMVVAGTACPTPASPNFLYLMEDQCSSSWVEFYRVVRETLNQEMIMAGCRCDHIILTCS